MPRLGEPSKQEKLTYLYSLQAKIEKAIKKVEGS